MSEYRLGLREFVFQWKCCQGLWRHRDGNLNENTLTYHLLRSCDSRVTSVHSWIGFICTFRPALCGVSSVLKSGCPKNCANCLLYVLSLKGSGLQALVWSNRSFLSLPVIPSIAILYIELICKPKTQIYSLFRHHMTLGEQGQGRARSQCRVLWNRPDIIYYHWHLFHQHILFVKFLFCLRSIVAHRDHFVRRPSVCLSVCLSGSHTFLLVTHSYVSQATHAFLGVLPLYFW